jgi:hypothetical protein
MNCVKTKQILLFFMVLLNSNLVDTSFLFFNLASYQA